MRRAGEAQGSPAWGQRRNEAAAGVLQSYDGGDGRERWAPKWIEGGDGKP